MSATADRFTSNTQSKMSAPHEAQQTQEAQKHSEGAATRQIENQTAKIPSGVFLMGALVSIGVSLAFELSGEKEKSAFVARWVSPFLLLGVYNKLVKVAGSDRVHAS
jgi:hypothetical protein